MKFLWLIAFAPAAFILGFRSYLRTHPPDSTEVGVRGLQRGLAIGAVSAVFVALLYILAVLHPIPLRGNLPYCLCALVGNILNLVALTDCLAELSGQSLFAAILLSCVQLAWVWYGFAALMSAN